MVQQVTANENEWQRVLKQVPTGGAKSNNGLYNEWQRVIQLVTANRASKTDWF